MGRKRREDPRRKENQFLNFASVDRACRRFFQERGLDRDTSNNTLFKPGPKGGRPTKVEQIARELERNSQTS